MPAAGGKNPRVNPRANPRVILWDLLWGLKYEKKRSDSCWLTVSEICQWRCDLSRYGADAESDPVEEERIQCSDSASAYRVE